LIAEIRKKRLASATMVTPPNLSIRVSSGVTRMGTAVISWVVRVLAWFCHQRRRRLWPVMISIFGGSFGITHA
jgi:hypothetical protein